MGVVNEAQQHAEEVDSLLAEGQKIYDAALATDTERVENIQKKYREALDIYEERQRIIKEAVIGLTKEIKVAEEARDQVIPDETHNEALAQLEKQIFAAGKGIKHAEKGAEEIKRAVEENKGDIKAIHDQIEQAKIDKEVDVPRARYKLNLYENITQLRWDYGLEDTNIKGWIGHPDRKDVQPFSIDATQRSSYFIPNYLWNII